MCRAAVRITHFWYVHYEYEYYVLAERHMGEKLLLVARKYFGTLTGTPCGKKSFPYPRITSLI